MVWSEYVQEAHVTEQLPIDDDEMDTGPQWEVVDLHTWVDWYEPHISNMWRDFLAYRQDTGINRIVCAGMSFWDFAQMLYTNSDKRTIPIA